jgi:hypothetical protein
MLINNNKCNSCLRRASVKKVADKRACKVCYKDALFRTISVCFFACKTGAEWPNLAKHKDDQLPHFLSVGRYSLHKQTASRDCIAVVGRVKIGRPLKNGDVFENLRLLFESTLEKQTLYKHNRASNFDVQVIDIYFSTRAESLKSLKRTKTDTHPLLRDLK